MSYSFHYVDESKRVLAIGKEAGTKGLSKAAYKVRGAMKRSIRRSKAYSKAGTPPHTRKGQLKRAILYDVDREAGIAVVGPAAHLFSDVASYHEHGGVQVKRGKRREYAPGTSGPIDMRSGNKDYIHDNVVFAKLRTGAQAERAKRIDRAAYPDATKPKRRRYPKRPFAGPALANTAPGLPKIWEDSFRR